MGTCETCVHFISIKTHGDNDQYCINPDKLISRVMVDGNLNPWIERIDTSEDMTCPLYKKECDGHEFIVVSNKVMDKHLMCKTCFDENKQIKLKPIEEGK